MLVVEDNVDILEVVCELLGQENYRVSAAENGRAALALLQTLELPCLILLDYFMPHMNGDELCAEMMKDPQLSEIPVIMMSAYGKREQNQKTPNVVAYLRKPVPMVTLLKTLETVAGKHALTESSGTPND